MVAVDLVASVGLAVFEMHAELPVKVVLLADLLAVRHAVHGGGVAFSAGDQEHRPAVPRPGTAIGLFKARGIHGGLGFDVQMLGAAHAADIDAQARSQIDQYRRGARAKAAAALAGDAAARPGDVVDRGLFAGAGGKQLFERLAVGAGVDGQAVHHLEDAQRLLGLRIALSGRVAAEKIALLHQTLLHGLIRNFYPALSGLRARHDAQCQYEREQKREDAFFGRARPILYGIPGGKFHRECTSRRSLFIGLRNQLLLLYFKTITKASNF